VNDSLLKTFEQCTFQFSVLRLQRQIEVSLDKDFNDVRKDSKPGENVRAEKNSNHSHNN